MTAQQALLKHGLDMNGQFMQGLTWEVPVKINTSVFLLEVEFGAYSYAAPHAELHYVRVGRYCSIGPHSHFLGSAHPTGWLSSHPFSYQNIYRHTAPYDPVLNFEGYAEFTTVGHDVWIGAYAFIRPGVKIGNGAIIGAGAVVAKDVPDYAIVVGNPGRVVKYRFDEKLIERMQKVQWWRFDLPKHMVEKPDLALDRPEVMLDYIEEHAERLPIFSGVKKKLLNSPEGLVIRTLAPSPGR